MILHKLTNKAARNISWRKSAKHNVLGRRESQHYSKDWVRLRVDCINTEKGYKQNNDFV